MDAGEWRRWERLVHDCGIVIDRPRGHAHPRYPDMIYPCDYGHVPGTTAADGEAIDVFVGAGQAGVVGLIALTHQPSGIREPKLLVNLSRADAVEILAFLDRGDPRPDLHVVWRHAAAPSANADLARFAHQMREDPRSFGTFGPVSRVA